MERIRITGVGEQEKKATIQDVILQEQITARMIEGFRKGYERGSTTYIPELDEHFTWLKGDINLIAGIGNHGKSVFNQQIMLLKSINEGVKWAVFTPEQTPADYFYNDLVHTFVGKNVEKHFGDRMDEDEYMAGVRVANEHFFYVYPKDERPTPDYIMSIFALLIKEHGVTGAVIDPFNQLDNDWVTTGRDDRYISIFLQRCKAFAVKNNVYFTIIIHPKAMAKNKNEQDYQCPDIFDFAGGAMWNNHADNIMIIHRPRKTSAPGDTEVLCRVAKIKKQKLVGYPGDIQVTFNAQKNRFYFNNNDYFEIHGQGSRLPF